MEDETNKNKKKATPKKATPKKPTTKKTVSKKVASEKKAPQATATKIERPESPKGNKGFTFLKKNILAIVLFLLLVIVFVWAKTSMNSLNKDFVQKKDEIVKSYEVKFDSLNSSKLKLTAKVFSWAIRSEMSRGNIEQVDQFFLTFIKEPKIEKLQLVDPATAIIVLSTDKKDEGQMITDQRILGSDSLITFKDSLRMRIATPIMGLNEKMGILIMDSKN